MPRFTPEERIKRRAKSHFKNPKTVIREVPVYRDVPLSVKTEVVKQVKVIERIDEAKVIKIAKGIADQLAAAIIKEFLKYLDAPSLKQIEEKVDKGEVQIKELMLQKLPDRIKVEREEPATNYQEIKIEDIEEQSDIDRIIGKLLSV